MIVTLVRLSVLFENIAPPCRLGLVPLAPVPPVRVRPEKLAGE